MTSGQIKKDIWACALWRSDMNFFCGLMALLP